jgi:hypothetical protein
MESVSVMSSFFTIIFASLIYFYFNVGGFLEKLMSVFASIFRSVGQTVISANNISSMMTGLWSLFSA